MFSILEPGKHLPPHRGPYNGVLRLHLGLIVPEPREQLGIRVENEVYRWREGEAVIFDDAYEHEAWNRTDTDPGGAVRRFHQAAALSGQLDQLAAAALAVFTPFIREGMDNQKAWEKRFYAEAEALRNQARLGTGGRPCYCRGSRLAPAACPIRPKIPTKRPPRRSASSRSAAPRRWSIPSASSPACAPRAMS